MLGYELRLWRKGCGWTQERAAEEFDVSLRTCKCMKKTKGIFPAGRTCHAGAAAAPHAPGV